MKYYKVQIFTELKNIASLRGGQCLSSEYLNTFAKLEWQCKEGHIWEATPKSIKNGSWCPECAKINRSKKLRSSIEEMHELARKRGGKCLSTEYANNNTKLRWQCSEGHIWKSTSNSIKRGTWCPECANESRAEKFRSSINEMQRIAIERGGSCLSNDYINGKTKLKWKCNEDHIWEATPNMIIRRSWCPICAVKNKAKNKRITIADLHTIAQKRGGKCLSKLYKNNQHKIYWECSAGHVWEATPNSIISGSWCPTCAGNKKSTIEAMYLLAESKRGICLSTIYINNTTKLTWQCSRGHIWESTPKNIKNGRWCPECAKVSGAKKRSSNIDEMQRIANERDGICLSNKYINGKTKLKWQCSKGHIWEAPPDRIKGGAWCPICSINIKAENQKYTIYDMQTIALERRGKCLSKSYKSSQSKLNWQCSKGHIWRAIPSSIIRGSWCPDCRINKKLTLEEMHKTAEERGGRCLSTSYVNSKTKLKWQCYNGHLWESVPGSIRLGTWCPECSTGLGERICRIFFEAIFGKKFSKYRPKWLINYEKNQMELDGFCKTLNLAFEHQGQQHSQHIKYFHTEETFAKRKRDDKEKEELCKEHGVTLIRIPEIPSILPIHKVQEYLLNKFIEAGVKNFPNDINSIKIDLKKAYLADSNNQFDQIKELARNKGGNCLSNLYLSSDTKLTFKCKNDHIFKLRPRHVKIGIWCPKCSRVKGAELRRLTIEEIQFLADSHDGKCLSKNYVNSHTKLRWQCKLGHVWETKPNNIQQGKWCPICGRKNSNEKRKLTLDQMKKIAQEKGGKCLSNLYVNANTKLLWQCNNGHIWEASPSNVKSGSWCPFCARSNKYPKNQLVLI